MKINLTPAIAAVIIAAATTAQAAPLPARATDATNADGDTYGQKENVHLAARATIPDVIGALKNCFGGTCAEKGESVVDKAGVVEMPRTDEILEKTSPVSPGTTEKLIDPASTHVHSTDVAEKLGEIKISEKPPHASSSTTYRTFAPAPIQSDVDEAFKLFLEAWRRKEPMHASSGTTGVSVSTASYSTQASGRDMITTPGDTRLSGQVDHGFQDSTLTTKHPNPLFDREAVKKLLAASAAKKHLDAELDLTKERNFFTDIDPKMVKPMSLDERQQALADLADKHDAPEMNNFIKAVNGNRSVQRAKLAALGTSYGKHTSGAHEASAGGAHEEPHH